LNFVKTRSTAAGAPATTAVQAADIIGRSRYLGSDGTTYVAGATIDVVVESTVLTNSVPMYMAFYTGTNGGGTERWRITSAGILQSLGSQTIQTATGNLTIATGAANGNVLLLPNGTGNIQ